MDFGHGLHNHDGFQSRCSNSLASNRSLSHFRETERHDFSLNSACALNLQTSTDFTTWSTPLICQLTSVPANSDFNISAFLLTTTVVNQQIKVIFVNSLASTVTFNSGNSTSFLNVVRIA